MGAGRGGSAKRIVVVGDLGRIALGKDEWWWAMDCELTSCATGGGNKEAACEAEGDLIKIKF